MCGRSPGEGTGRTMSVDRRNSNKTWVRIVVLVVLLGMIAALLAVAVIPGGS